MAYLLFKRDWEGAGRKFQEGQVIEVHHKIDKKTQAVILDISTHRQWVAKGLCSVHLEDPTPKEVLDAREKREKERKKEPSVEVEFIQDWPTSTIHYRVGHNYVIPGFRARKFIERGLCIPCTKRREAAVATNMERR